MRYELELDINAPRDRVIQLFDAGRLKEWQPSLVRYEQLSGQGMRGVGSQSKQLHRMGRREVEMLATVTVDNPPEQMSATYESGPVWNLIENWFEDRGDVTHWTLASEFRCKGIFMNVMLRVFPGMFKKQTREYMQYFKDFVEKEVAA